MRAFLEKTAELLDQRVHLLIIDLFPPGPRDPQGLHAAIWEEIAGVDPPMANDKLLTLAAYESALTIRAYVRPVSVGDALPEMPLFLEPEACVMTPLDRTYQTAFSGMPRRWSEVLSR